MATATQNKRTNARKRRRTKPADRATARRGDAGELLWTCPDCGTEHPEATRACGCEYVRPPLEALSEQLTPASAQLRDALPDTLGEAAAAALEAGESVETEIALDRLHLRSDNPHAHDPGEIKALARSIDDVGLQNRIVVRLQPGEGANLGQFDVWQGEGRVKALRLLKRKTAPVRIVCGSDAEMVRARADENLRREELTPIGRARTLQQLLEAGGYKSQRSLAKEIGISQPQIAQLVGLLKLPETLQGLVEDGTLSFSAARELLPAAELPPQVLALAEKRLRADSQRRGTPITPFDCQDEVDDAILEASRPLSGSYGMEAKPYGRYERVLLTKAQKSDPELQVHEVEVRGQKEKRAFNCELWGRFQAAGLERRKQRDQADATGSAQAKQPPAEKREQARRQAERLEKAIARYRIAWLQRAALGRLDQLTDDGVIRCLLHFAVENRGALRRNDEAVEALREFGAKPRSKRGRGGDDLVDVLESSAGPAIAMARAILGRWLGHPFEWHSDCDLRPEDVERLAGELGVDLAGEWRVDEEFLQLHTIGQLKQLAKAWKITPQQTAKAKLIAELVELDAGREKPLPAPASLVKANADLL